MNLTAAIVKTKELSHSCSFASTHIEAVVYIVYICCASNFEYVKTTVNSYCCIYKKISNSMMNKQ